MKITLRELFLIALVVALICGWYVDSASNFNLGMSYTKWMQDYGRN